MSNPIINRYHHIMPEPMGSIYGIFTYTPTIKKTAIHVGNFRYTVRPMDRLYHTKWAPHSHEWII